MATSLARIVPPALPLLTLQEAREQCRVTETSEDAVLQAYVAAASEYLDGVIGEALVTQTWRLAFDGSPSGNVELPIGPVQSVASIKYVDLAGAEQTVAGASYRLAGNIVELVSGASWPATDSRTLAFWIDFVAGYGSPSAVPLTIRQIARLLVGHWYDTRQSVVVGSIATAIPHGVELLLQGSRAARGLF